MPPDVGGGGDARGGRGASEWRGAWRGGSSAARGAKPLKNGRFAGPVPKNSQEFRPWGSSQAMLSECRPVALWTEKVYTISVMQRRDYADKIKERLDNSDDGTLFVMSDFIDIAPNNAANRVVLRLLSENKLRTIMRGIYQKPKVNALLGECEEPSCDDVAAALSRKNGWTICPNGDTALNLLGLSTQVPAVWKYLSSGPYRTYPYGAGTIAFTHTSNRMINRLSSQTALLVQALRALGENHVEEETVKKLADRYTEKQLEEMERETRNVTDWIHTKIMRMKELKNA